MGIQDQGHTWLTEDLILDLKGLTPISEPLHYKKISNSGQISVEISSASSFIFLKLQRRKYLLQEACSHDDA